jgi:GNAT superfamily N-acetyltransferase
MKIERLNENTVTDVYCCLGDRREFYKNEIAESLTYMREKLRLGWLAYAVYEETNKPIGMALLVPAADPLSPVAGEKIYYFHCLDINKDKRKQGIALKLIEHITGEVKALGGKGLAVDCFGEYWMPCSFFAKIGFEPGATFTNHTLLIKRIVPDADARYREQPYAGDLPRSGIQVDIQLTPTCPFMVHNYRQVPAMVKKIDPAAIVRERLINTPGDIERWGGGGVFVNGKSVSSGPVDESDLWKSIQAAKTKT